MLLSPVAYNLSHKELTVEIVLLSFVHCREHESQKSETALEAIEAFGIDFVQAALAAW